MTEEQLVNVLRLSTYSDTCTLADLKRAIGSEEITLSTMKEAWIFVKIYRLAKANRSSDQKDDITVIIDESLAKDLTALQAFLKNSS